MYEMGGLKADEEISEARSGKASATMQRNQNGIRKTPTRVTSNKQGRLRSTEVLTDSVGSHRTARHSLFANHLMWFALCARVENF